MLNLFRPGGVWLLGLFGLLQRRSWASFGSFLPGGVRLLGLLRLHWPRRRWRLLPEFHAEEHFNSDVIRSRVGGFDPLRLEVAFLLDVPISEVSIPKVLISIVLVLGEGVVDILIVVVTYVIAVIDTAVAKVMKEARVFWRLTRARFSSSGGGSRACLFVAASSWRSWSAVLACERGGVSVLAVHDGASGAVSLAAQRRAGPIRVLR